VIFVNNEAVLLYCCTVPRAQNTEPGNPAEATRAELLRKEPGKPNLTENGYLGLTMN
jgi:hypothetical protein